MIKKDGFIELEGLDKLLEALKKCDGEVVEAALQGLQAGGLEIIADAQQNLRRNGSVVTGLLRQSGKVLKNRTKQEITVGFFDTTNKTGYAEYVEYGRPPGKMPPPDVLAAWAYKKFHLRDWKAANAMGWGAAVNIAKNGTEPHPFFGPAIKKNYRKLVNAVRKAINKVTK